MLDPGRLGQLPHQRVFAPPRTDDEKLHYCRASAGGISGVVLGAQWVNWWRVVEERADFETTPQRGTADLILSYPLSPTHFSSIKTSPPLHHHPPPPRSPPPPPLSRILISSLSPWRQRQSRKQGPVSRNGIPALRFPSRRSRLADTRVPASKRAPTTKLTSSSGSSPSATSRPKTTMPPSRSCSPGPRRC